MELETIMLGEISQTQKILCSLRCGIWQGEKVKIKGDFGECTNGSGEMRSEYDQSTLDVYM
jgi:hypothetical protein